MMVTTESTHQFVPPFILENLAMGKRQGGFPALGLFVDISGFTPMTETLMKYGPHGAEVLAAVMREVFDPLIRNVFEGGGFIIGLAGDAFTALFPLESETLETYWLAVAAAWRIQRTVTSQAIRATAYGDFPLSIKVGLAAGDVRWGIVTSTDERRATYYFQGSAVDGCTECEHQAGAGEIVMDARVYEKVKARVSAEAAVGYYHLLAVQSELPPALPVALPPAAYELQERFFPRELLTQTYNGEFRQVVVMFIRLPTVRTEYQLEIFMRSLFDLQDRYGGLLNRLDFGDKGSHLLLFWGAPIAHENDVERALNLILDLQQQTSIPINAGITYKIAHAGCVGSVLSEEYTCYGQGINLAARFMTAAPRGEIWVDTGIARRGQEKFEIEFEGRRSFKGFAEDQDVYLLVERKDRVEGFYQSKMVGRRAETSQIAKACAPVWAGQYAGAWVVLGEAGVGKSRLVHEWMRSARIEHPNSLWALCQTDEIVREPLNPFRYWLRTYFDVSTAQVETRNKRNFNRKLDDLIADTQVESLAAELDRTRSFLAALLDLYWPDSLYSQLDAQARYENTLLALAVLFQAESLHQPVVVIIEDAQWLDSDSRRFLPQLARTLVAEDSRSYPLALLSTARREASQNMLGEGLDYGIIDLKGISAEELAEMAEAQLGGPVAAELIHLLVERSEGNPFFAEQILAFLKDGELLEQIEGVWTSGKREVELLPEDVRAVMVARLDRLVQKVKEVVQAAAILGREFEIQLLARMLGRASNLQVRVAEAEKSAIWSPLSELRYMFKHAMLREVAYRMQLRSRRQALHALAVEALESLAGAELSPRYSELAYHAEQGGLEEKARFYLRQAGAAAVDAYQNSQAIDYFTRALALTPEEETEERFTLVLAREAVSGLLGNQEARRADLAALADLAEVVDGLARGQGQRGRGAAAQVALRQADYAFDISDFPTAVTAAEEAVQLSMEAGMLETIVQAYNIWSLGLVRMGEFDEATRQAVAGLQVARENSDRRGESMLLNLLGLIALEQHYSSTACMFLSQSLQIANEIGDQQAAARPLSNLGTATANEGDFSAARDYYQQMLAITQEIGDRQAQGIGLTNLGWLAGVLGDYAAARAFGKQVLQIARQVGNRHQEAYALVNFSSWAVAQSDWEAAQAYAQESLNINRAIGDRSGEAWSLTYLGHACSGSGQLEQAAQAYSTALEIRRALEQPALETEPLAGLAQVAQASGDLTSALAYLEDIFGYLDGGGTLEGAEEPMRVYWICFRILQAAQDPRAEKILALAYEQLQSRAALISDGATHQAFLENVPYHRSIMAAWKGRSADNLPTSRSQSVDQPG